MSATHEERQGHTPGPWYVGAQNDELFVVAGRSPAANNDYPWHDADRVAIARILLPTEGDCLPVQPEANARLIAAAPEMLAALKRIAERDFDCAPHQHAMAAAELAKRIIAKEEGRS